MIEPIFKGSIRPVSIGMVYPGYKEFFSDFKVYFVRDNICAVIEQSASFLTVFRRM
jgi:hypothetical protein